MGIFYLLLQGCFVYFESVHRFKVDGSSREYLLLDRMEATKSLAGLICLIS